MIRQAENSDYPHILDLWDMCFGEDKIFNDWFFANRFKISETLVYEKYGKIISMLQIMPCCIRNIGKAGYIYGACTHKDFRKCGIMSKLLSYAQNICSTTILIPQNESLFGFYSKFGYEPCTFTQIKEIPENSPDKDIEISYAQNDDLRAMNKIYENQCENFVIRDNSYWQMQLRMFKETGGKVFCMNENGTVRAYAFFFDGFIQEMFPEDICFAKKIGELTSKKIKYMASGKKPFACINKKNQKIYINIMFN